MIAPNPQRIRLATQWPLLVLLGLLIPTFPSVSAESKQPRPIQLKDLAGWKSIRSVELSRDGKWLSVLITPNDGDAELIVRQSRGKKEHRFAVGALPGSAGSFSADSKWLAFSVSPTKEKQEALKKSKSPIRNRVTLLALDTGKTTEFENVAGFDFSGDAADWIALQKYAPEPASGAKGGANAGSLVLRNLKSGESLTFGNVDAHTFNKSGDWLAIVLDTPKQESNAVQLFHLPTKSLQSLDADKASYRRLSWTKEGDALAILKGNKDKAYKNERISVLGFRAFAPGKAPEKVVFDPEKTKGVPKGMTVSPNRAPRWSDDRTLLSFGIHKLEKAKADEKKDSKPATKKPVVTTKATTTKEGKAATNGEQKKPKETKKERRQRLRAERRAKRNAKAAAPKPETKKEDKKEDAKAKKDAKPADLVVWHWKDKRLQSEQQKQEIRDKNQSYLCVYHVSAKRFVRLADDKVRDVSLAPKERWAIGIDDQAYRLMGSLDGRRYRDFYVIDVQTGKRKLALKKARWYFGPSPDGTHFLYFENGHYHTCEMLTCTARNLTENVPTSFHNTEDDHNVVKPPIRPIGWTKGGESVLLSDNWDVWRVDRHGDVGVNLTVDGREKQIRYQRRMRLDPDEEGIDLTQPVYFLGQNEWTKEAGIVCVENGAPGAKRLVWDKASFGGLQKAKDADVFAYQKQTNVECPNVHVANGRLQSPKRVTDVFPEQKDYLWSSGVKLVNYTNSDGVKLQAALFLPANYESGKKFPTILYMYEKLSGTAFTYQRPYVRGFNRSIYNSNGYAVLMPDIKYKVNDPGLSSVDCLKAALKAGIATGVIDPKRVGIHGHSWGGYQTAFMITQSKAFKAAVAGAPLTNLISMYSSIYWNTGSTNQPIFESSQGRFEAPYWDMPDAYVRNSPVYHAKSVTTPLLLLHNDKDGAVDWNQGIEYFNTLRRLRKPVVMLQYKGENHGLVKAENRRDYTVRMQEFFDHYLKGKPAPKWLKEGIPHLDHGVHLKERAKAEAFEMQIER